MGQAILRKLQMVCDKYAAYLFRHLCWQDTTSGLCFEVVSLDGDSVISQQVGADEQQKIGIETFVEGFHDGRIMITDHTPLLPAILFHLAFANPAVIQRPTI
jgi:hypothetical protein